MAPVWLIADGEYDETAGPPNTVDGRRRWILTPQRFGSYRAKSCPGAVAEPTVRPT